MHALVPLVQQSAVDFQNDPEATNAAILQAVIDLDTFWQLSAEGMANTVAMMDSLGIVSNGDDDILGNFDLDRVDNVISIIDSKVPSIKVSAGLSASDLVTNRFIDPTIGR